MKIVAQNKRVRFDYEISQEIEAGIMLTGQEAKSARAGGMDLHGAYVSFISGRPVLKNATIQPYRYASNLTDYEPGRERVLLLSKKEIAKLQGVTAEKGISILPLEVRAGHHIKIVLGIGRGRKKYDKRKVIKERDVEKRMRRGDEI